MEVQASNSSELYELFQDLQNGFSFDSACAFMRACWLWPEDFSKEQQSLERLIYTQGNRNEIYTLNEREIISRFDQQINYCHYRLSSLNRKINCRTILVDLNEGTDSIRAAIALMKIINKAITGFNIFLFVSSEGLLIGCSCIKGSSIGRDCVISPVINHLINWDLLYDVFLFRNDSSDFYDYYSGVVSAVLSIPDCYVPTEENNEDFLSYYKYYSEDYYDIDTQEDYRLFSDFQKYDYQCREDRNEEQYFDKECFLDDVQNYMDEFSYIKANEINPLELLFEAQKAYDTAYRSEHSHSEATTSTYLTDSDVDKNAFEMLDDPIALMKMLKKQRGI